MSSILAIILSGAAVIAILYAYSNIRQGGARVYTLEREAILRRGSTAMFLGTGLLIVSVAMLLYQNQQAASDEGGTPVSTSSFQTTEEGDVIIANTPAARSGEDNQLPALETITPTPTLDPLVPTATPTPIIIRGFVTGTGGNGLYLRTTPGGEQITILQEDEFVTVLEGEGRVEQNGVSWVKVRTFLGDEGWVAADFLELEGR